MYFEYLVINNIKKYILIIKIKIYKPLCIIEYDIVFSIYSFVNYIQFYIIIVNKIR